MLKSNVTKKWFAYALINMVMLTTFFGVLILSYGIIVSNNTLYKSEEIVESYAEELSRMRFSDLVSIANGDVVKYGSSVRRDCTVALYTFRADGSLEMTCADAWLRNENPGISYKDNDSGREAIGGAQYITCHYKLSNSSENAYVKVFMSLQTIDAARTDNISTNIIFIVTFIIGAILLSIAMAYLEIRPIAKSYEEQKRFINDISHEIRTPLTVIKGNVENILAKPDCTVSEVNDELYELVNEVEYMTEMTTGMLTIVRNSNKSSGAKDTNISDIVRSVVDVYGELTSVSQRALIASIDNVSMNAEKEKIKQLLMILLDNALKYTNEGDRIVVKLRAKTKGCILSVSDTGIGVPQAELENIFERFYRASNTGAHEGTGLGLSIAKSIVESYGGTIEAKQNVPSGLIIIAELMQKD